MTQLGVLGTQFLRKTWGTVRNGPPKQPRDRPINKIETIESKQWIRCLLTESIVVLVKSI